MKTVQELKQDISTLTDEFIMKISLTDEKKGKKLQDMLKLFNKVCEE